MLQSWYERYGEELYNTLCSAVRNSDLARDISQEAFLKMAVKLEKPGAALEIENPRAFLYKIAYNELYTRHRKQKLEQHLCEVFATRDYEYIEHITPENIALSREELRKVKEAINALPRKQKQAFNLSRDGNSTHKEIAAQLGIRQGTVKQHIVRALQGLRDVRGK